MRIAHLLMVHRGPAQVERLVRALAHPQATVFIHLDAKANQPDYLPLAALPGVRFIGRRHDVKWAAFSLVEAMLTGISEILAAEGEPYDYINLLSGQDYPLRPAAEIHDFLDRHAGQSFFSYENPDSAWWAAGALNRLAQYHFVGFSFPFRYGVQRLLNRWLPRRRLPLPGYTLYGGPCGSWWTMTREAAAYFVAFVDQRPALRRFARLTWGIDEILPATILLNSPLRDTIINNNFRYIDWSAGGANPKVLGAADAPALLASPDFYARKFDLAHDSQVFDILDQARLLLPQ